MYQHMLPIFKSRHYKDDNLDFFFNNNSEDQQYGMVLPAFQYSQDSEEDKLNPFGFNFQRLNTEAPANDQLSKFQISSRLIQSKIQEFIYHGISEEEQPKKELINQLVGSNHFYEINLEEYQDNAPALIGNKPLIQQQKQLKKMKKVKKFRAKKIKKKLKLKKNGDVRKGDSVKNVWGNSFRFILRQLFSNKYQTQIQRLCSKFKTTPIKIKRFYVIYLNQLISLSKLRVLLDQRSALSKQQRQVKKVFYIFYIWFMRNKYTQHIIQSDDIFYKKIYIEAKNRLVYLPNARIKVKPTKPSSADW